MDKLKNKEVSLSQGLVYSLPVILTTFLLYPVASILPGIYAKHFGISLATIATVMLVSRLFDAVTDPLIGYFSDRYRERTGTRKPWVVAGCIGVVISSYFLYVPPEKVSTGYFLGWFLAFYLTWTIVEIPHLAWGGELTSSSHEATRIYSLRSLCLLIGVLLFTLVPMLPFFSGQGFTPKTLQWSALAAVVLMFPLLLMCVKSTPNGRAPMRGKKETPQLVLSSFLQNKPLLILLGGFFLISIGWGLWFGITFIFADAYLGLGEKLPLAYAFGSVVGLVSIGVLYKFSSRLDKALLGVFAVTLSAVSIVAMAFLSPGKDALILFMILMSMIYIGNALMQVMIPSMLSDVVDYSTWKFGVDRAATYFSVNKFLDKTGLSIGGALGFWLAGWYGFDPAAVSHTEEGIFGLHLAVAYMPTVFFFLSLILIAIMPINRRRHQIIQRRLASRIQRSSHHDLLEPSQVLPEMVTQT